MEDGSSFQAPARAPTPMTDISNAPGQTPEPNRDRAQPESGSRRAWAGLLIRKECWTLSWRARLLALALALTAAVVSLKTVYPFLAVTSRAGADVLIVEGWIPVRVLKDAAA